MARWLRPALTDLKDFEGRLTEVGVPRPRIVVHNRTALQTMLAVATSDLLTVAPRQWLELPALDDSLQALPWMTPMEAVPVCLVRRIGAPLTPMAKHLCDVVRRLGAQYVRRSAAGRA